MALSATQLRILAVDFCRDELIVSNKPDAIAMMTAVEAWCDDNGSSFNSAIPQPFRTSLTTQQKARLLAVVATARVGA